MKPTDYTHYRAFADVFRYPSESFPEEILRCRNVLKDRYPKVLECFDTFAQWAANTPLNELEEVYTKTFHIQAICYLDLGFVIFGEDYKRGSFLVNMKNKQEAAKNDCGNELPDNLVNVLTLIPLVHDYAFRDELVGLIIIPALEKMLGEFSTARMELRTKMLKKKHHAVLQESQRNGNVYQFAIRALLDIFRQDFEHVLKENTNTFQSPEVLHQPVASTCGTCSFTSHRPIKTEKP